MSTLTLTVTDRRVFLSSQRRAEEQVVAAVLHASSILGFLAIIASSSVWSNQRMRSRFLAIQARQALMFQIVITVGQLITFLLFMAGFYVAAFGGLIARSGVSEPELTATLIIAAVLGGAAIVFFLVLLPLAGVWAAIRILHGHNFLYPILGRRVVAWYSQRYDASETASSRHSSEFDVKNDDTTLAGVAHLSILVGLAPIVAATQWATAPNRSIHLTFNLMQAALYQFCLMGVLYIGFCAFRVIGILLLAPAILPVIAAIRSFAGRDFCYPVVGNWLARYLGLGVNGAA